MGRLTNVYAPVAFVLVSRVSEVCSAFTVTVALGIYAARGSVTSPVIPPSVCCANSEPQHSATAAATASNRETEEGKICLEYFNSLTSKIGDFINEFSETSRTHNE
jgi:hypothetical protein